MIEIGAGRRVRALRGRVLVHNVDNGDYQTKGGIIMLDDNGKPHGIRERWGQVYAIGSDVDDVEIGDWVLIKHGRWSRGIDILCDGEKTTIRQIDYPDAILLVSETNPLLDR